MQHELLFSCFYTNLSFGYILIFFFFHYVQFYYLSCLKRRSNLSGPTKVAAINRQHSAHAGAPFFPQPSAYWHLFFHNSCQRTCGEMSEGVCWGRGEPGERGWWVERTRGWRGHTLNPWVKMYLLKINNQAAISSCSRWFYNLVSGGQGGREGGGEERSGTKTSDAEWEALSHCERRIQYCGRFNIRGGLALWGGVL